MLLLAEIHLIQSTQFGILTNSEFNQRFDNHAHDTNNRFDFLCSKAKKGFTSHVKSPNQPRHYTNVPTSATCYYCLKEYNKVAFPRGKIITEF
jgi:hypothetical protein